MSVAGNPRAAITLLPKLEAEHAERLPYYLQLLLWHAPVATLTALVDTPELQSIDSSPVADAAAAFVATGPEGGAAGEAAQSDTASVRAALQRYLEGAAAKPGAGVCVHDLLVAVLATTGNEEALLRCAVRLEGL